MRISDWSSDVCSSDLAATPETVKKFIGLGAEVAVESGAGEQASIADADYSAAGAIVGNRVDALKGANIILAVQGPDPKGLSGFAEGAWPAAGLNPFGARARVDDFAKQHGRASCWEREYKYV